MIPFDVMFSALIPFALVKGLAPTEMLYSLLVLYGLGLIRSGLIQLMFGRVFGPIGRWLESTSALPESREVREVDGMIRRAPGTVTVWIGALWGLGHTVTILTVGGAIVLAVGILIGAA